MHPIFIKLPAGSKLLALVLFVLAAVSSCGPENIREANNTTGERVFTDDLGRAVQLPEQLNRAVSLAPSLTETIFAAGAGSRLVGVTTYCNYPKEAESIAKVGDTQTPNIESIVALQPQVIFVSTASQLEPFMRTLDERNIAVFVTSSAGLDDVFRHIRLFGEMFGTGKQAESTITELRGRLEAVRGLSAGKGPKSVFLQISKEPLFTIGKESFLTEAISLAGGHSVTRDVSGGYPKISKETASAMNPDVIILSDSEDNKEANDIFKHSPAVKNGRVYRINADIISRPGPRVVDAVEQVSEVLRGS